jgi:soluble lytic murein transglycosylase-like protein
MGKVYLLFSVLVVLVVFLASNSQIVISQTNPPAQTPNLIETEKPSLGTFSTGDPTIDRYIVESSARYNIDPLLILAQMKQESGFKQKAISHKGASGLMQLMPATARRFGVTNIYDPAQNIDAGVKYMRFLLNKFNGDVKLALAGYNAGEGAVMKYGNQIPPYRETQGYVTKITAHYAQIKTPAVAKNILSNKAMIQEIAKAL